MSVRAEAPATKLHAWLPLLGCALLLLMRLAFIRPGVTSLAGLCLVYISILVLARPAAVAAHRGGVAVPLMVGIGAVLAGPLVLRSEIPSRVTTIGLAVNVLAAVAEEAFFRGALFNRLSDLGAGTAIVGSAVAFAFLHLPFYGLAALPVDLGAGLLFAWQRSASGRWAVPAATHAVANLLAVLR